MIRIGHMAPVPNSTPKPSTVVKGRPPSRSVTSSLRTNSSCRWLIGLSYAFWRWGKGSSNSVRFEEVAALREFTNERPCFKTKVYLVGGFRQSVDLETC